MVRHDGVLSPHVVTADDNRWIIILSPGTWNNESWHPQHEYCGCQPEEGEESATAPGCEGTSLRCGCQWSAFDHPGNG